MSFVNPFVPVSELEIRQTKLANLMPVGSLFIIFSNELLSRNADVEYPFRQDSSFWYLTGINKPDSAMTIFKDWGGSLNIKLYIQNRNTKEETWNGTRLSKEEAMELSNIDNIGWFSEFIDDIKQFKRLQTVYFDQKESYFTHRLGLLDYFRVANKSGKHAQIIIDTTSELLQEIRVIKSDWEIQQLKHASNINILAHKFANQNLIEAFKNHPNDVYKENDFESDLYYQYGKNGLTWSYPAIVASGQNGCTLHYGANNDKIQPNELLLVDAGCEYNYYASDVTRCYHPTGNWSQAQKQIYSAVLETNQKIIEFLSTGTATFLSYHTKSVELLSQTLLDLGILNGSLESVLETKSYKKYYMHSIGHWLGLDVHDLAKYLDSNSKRIDTPFVPNMVVTVEPGLYFHPLDETIPKEYRGIAVRIEDDIVIQENGVMNLTQNLIK